MQSDQKGQYLQESTKRGSARKPALVILTTHFGLNFSGGSTATCEIFSRLQSEFSSIVVIGTEVGEHSFKHVIFKPYRNLIEAFAIIKSIDEENVIFYGDFYNSILFTVARKSFFFTYHDNWPELGNVSPGLKLSGLYYWTIYRRIFRCAQHVFTVSDFKKSQVSRYTNDVSMIRNGIGHLPRSSEPAIRKNILMVGNIDKRKYSKAIELFKHLEPDPGITVDIFGHSIDKNITLALKQFSFVRIKGFVPSIPYYNYSLLLHTSLMENLSIVWCESIANRTPVLTFDVGGAPEVISHARGTLIPPYDITEMKRHLIIKSRMPTPLLEANLLQNEYSWELASDSYRQKLLPQ